MLEPTQPIVARRIRGATIQVRGDRLQINLPRSIHPEGRQQRITSGLPNTPEGMAACERIIERMNIDIMHGVFDFELVRYGLPKLANRETHLRLLESKGKSKKPDKGLELKELWVKYLEYRKGTLAPTTYRNTYERVYDRMVDKIPDNCKDALDIRNWILSNYTPIYQKRILQVLSKCYQWGMKHKLVSEDPFLGMGEEVKSRKVNKMSPKSVTLHGVDFDEDYTAFTAQERDEIIAAFENGSHRKHWANFVKFLFYTGCRPGEALALRWKHISSDFKVINFEDAFGLIQNKTSGYIPKDTKTGKARKFRLNEGGKLYSLLKDIKPEGAKPEDLVFTSPSGGVASWKRFCICWRGFISDKPSGQVRTVGVVPQLVRDGKVSQYLKPYATRHTFITLALGAGANIADIAKQVGNSPAVIMQFYASASRNLALPEV